MAGHILILTNPGGGSDRQRKTSDAREAWARFHRTPADRSSVIEIPDIRGVPDTVASLGSFRGLEIEGGRTIRCASRCWLVTDAGCKTLWIVAEQPRTIRELRRAVGSRVSAILYQPPSNSRKYHPTKPFRHEFGDTGGKRPRWDWPRYRPRLAGLDSTDRAVVLVRPPGGYTVEPRGIVG